MTLTWLNVIIKCYHCAAIVSMQWLTNICPIYNMQKILDVNTFNLEAFTLINYQLYVFKQW